jgi:hypothetical protein
MSIKGFDQAGVGGVKIRDELILTCNRGDFPGIREKNRELSPFSTEYT